MTSTYIPAIIRANNNLATLIHVFAIDPANQHTHIYHCYILEHEDLGMMDNFELV